MIKNQLLQNITEISFLNSKHYKLNKKQFVITRFVKITFI